jgi:hypothetical protein
MLEGKLVCTSFLSWWKVVVGNALVPMKERNLEGARFPSWCNVVVGNALVPMEE